MVLYRSRSDRERLAESAEVVAHSAITQITKVPLSQVEKGLVQLAKRNPYQKATGRKSSIYLHPTPKLYLCKELHAFSILIWFDRQAA